MSRGSDAPIEFIDPVTGEYYTFAARKLTVDLAYKMGFLPASEEDMDRAEAIDFATTDDADSNVRETQ